MEEGAIREIKAVPASERKDLPVKITWEVGETKGKIEILPLAPRVKQLKLEVSKQREEAPFSLSLPLPEQNLSFVEREFSPQEAASLLKAMGTLLTSMGNVLEFLSRR